MHTICLGNQGKNTQWALGTWKNHGRTEQSMPRTLCAVLPFLSVKDYLSCISAFLTVVLHVPLFSPLASGGWGHLLHSSPSLCTDSSIPSLANGFWAINPSGSQWFQAGHSQDGVCWCKVQAWHQWVTEEPFLLQSRARLWVLVFQFLHKSTGFCLLSLEHLLKFLYWSGSELQKATANKTPLSRWQRELTSQTAVKERWQRNECTDCAPIYTDVTA